MYGAGTEIEATNIMTPTIFAGALFLVALVFNIAFLLRTYRQAQRGEIPRNPRKGIRTPATMRSDAAWYEGQKVGTKILVQTGVPLHTLGGVVMVAAMVYQKDTALWPTVAILGLWVVGYVIIAVLAATKASAAANGVNGGMV
ncbi:SdpI family protein [Mycobacteroides abscessus subsp. massiliense]|uniref:SdpI family protein n=1 Tax=Mycobacteroides abscessus TaxID=36809 RepID=UPI000F61C669|nr:SdpI family protein [Mycobacteroides abscessus]RRE00656.1 SdpI family protein [Mycobacteroides abscessus subsp. massiliense]